MCAACMRTYVRACIQCIQCMIHHQRTAAAMTRLATGHHPQASGTVEPPTPREPPLHEPLSIYSRSQLVRLHPPPGRTRDIKSPQRMDNTRSHTALVASIVRRPSTSLRPPRRPYRRLRTSPSSPSSSSSLVITAAKCPSAAPRPISWAIAPSICASSHGPGTSPRRARSRASSSNSVISPCCISCACVPLPPPVSSHLPDAASRTPATLADQAALLRGV